MPILPRSYKFLSIKPVLIFGMEPLNTNFGVHEVNNRETISKVDNLEKIIVCDQHLDGTDTNYYKDGANYWSSVDPSVNGMLGGFGNISNIDIEGSAKFLKGIFKVSYFV